MHVFLTGATGYIGAAVAAALAAAGHSVTGLARNAAAAAQLRAAGHSTHLGDLTDPQSLRSGAAQADAVIHTAADRTGGDFSARDRGATTSLLDAVGGSGRPFIYTGGTGIYGDTADRVVTEQDTPVESATSAERLAPHQQHKQQVSASVGHTCGAPRAGAIVKTCG